MGTRDFWGVVSRAIGVDLWFTGVTYYTCGLDQQPLGKYVVNPTSVKCVKDPKQYGRFGN